MFNTCSAVYILLSLASGMPAFSTLGHFPLSIHQTMPVRADRQMHKRKCVVGMAGNLNSIHDVRDN